MATRASTPTPISIGWKIILNLTRDLGVNLAGVEVILNMREKMSKLQAEVEELFKYIREHVSPGEEPREP